MTDLHRQIEDLEKRAAESALIAGLATDPEVRLYNTGLARELRGIAAKLRERLVLDAA